MAGDEVLELLFAELGGPGFIERLESDFPKLDESACDRIVGVAAGKRVTPFGAAKAHPRDVHDDFGELLHHTVARWPDRFLTLVAADEHLRTSSSVLWVLGDVDHPMAGQLLVDAVEIRRAGYSFTRWAALKSLTEMSHPDLPDLLVALVKDRDSLVRSSATDTAIGFGDPRLLPILRQIATAERTPPGTRESALDAIEAIVVRYGLPDTDIGSRGRRLVEVRRPSDKARVVSLAQIYWGYEEVATGQELAVLKVNGRNQIVLAPCGGAAVISLLRVGGLAPEFMFWIRP
ncbi:HEAT repeat domain-containing protein [Catelliglobosispora koreensis]|uniref:HEAT repeat domain-containing protein n=1 Tax=Catelliglobosispora koreensis TaxID=129052 RepID=UPI000369FE04|nr:HEAT repeat domain-containing protein [Catelliglobosispora koreensis]